MFGFSQASLDFLQAVLDFRKQVWNLQLGQNRDLQITDTTEKNQNQILIGKPKLIFFLLIVRNYYFALQICNCKEKQIFLMLASGDSSAMVVSKKNVSFLIMNVSQLLCVRVWTDKGCRTSRKILCDTSDILQIGFHVDTLHVDVKYFAHE